MHNYELCIIFPFAELDIITKAAEYRTAGHIKAEVYLLELKSTTLCGYNNRHSKDR